MNVYAHNINKLVVVYCLLTSSSLASISCLAVSSWVPIVMGIGACKDTGQGKGHSHLYQSPHCMYYCIHTVLYPIAMWSTVWSVISLWLWEYTAVVYTGTCTLWAGQCVGAMSGWLWRYIVCLSTHEVCINYT